MLKNVFNNKKGTIIYFWTLNQIRTKTIFKKLGWVGLLFTLIFIQLTISRSIAFFSPMFICSELSVSQKICDVSNPIAKQKYSIAALSSDVLYPKIMCIFELFFLFNFA